MKRLLMTLVAVAFFGQLANAQLRTYTTNEEDSMACVQSLSLYIEYFKQDNYKDALPGWREATRICPKSTESIWINGVKLMQGLIKQTKDAERKQQLIDSMLWAYDMRIEHFARAAGKEGYVLGRKGSDMIKYRPKDPKSAYEVLKKSLDLQGNDMEAGASIYLYKAGYDMYRKKMAEKAMLFDLYDELTTAVEYNIANQSNANMKGAYEKALENIDKMIGSVANCEELIEIFSPQLDAAPQDVELSKKIVKLLSKQGCDDADLYQKAAVVIYSNEPSPKAAYSIAMAYYKKKNMSEALKYFKETTANSEDDDLSYKAYKYGGLAFLQNGQAQSAKGYADKMLAINPNSGEAYITIANAYAQTAGDCGGNACEKRAAYWRAVDVLYQAKSVDPSVADQAQKLINSYTAQFPKKEDCFFQGINDGNDYSLGCWIGGTTTVRTRAQ